MSSNIIEVNHNCADFAFPLCVLPEDSYYDAINDIYFVAINVSEIDSLEFIELTNKISGAAIEGYLDIDEADWEIKELCKYGNTIYLPYEVDMLGFATITYQTASGTKLFDVCFKPSSDVTVMLRRLADHVIIYDQVVE